MEEVLAGRKPEPEVLVVDVRMDGLDGFELVSRLREMASRLPSITFFTSSTHPDDGVRASELGARLAAKPIHIADFERFLHDLVA